MYIYDYQCERDLHKDRNIQSQSVNKHFIELHWT